MLTLITEAFCWETFDTSLRNYRTSPPTCAAADDENWPVHRRHSDVGEGLYSLQATIPLTKFLSAYETCLLPTDLSLEFIW